MSSLTKLQSQQKFQADQTSAVAGAKVSLPRPFGRSMGIARSVLVVLVYIFAALLLWQAVVTVFAVDPLVLPGPVPVLTALVNQLQSPFVYGAAWVTFQEAMIGFVLGAGVGIVLAVVLSEWPVTHRILNPYIVAFQAAPKIAFAPLFIIWFGFGMESKIILIATLVFFPILINMYTGLRSVAPEQVELMRVSHASRWQTLRRLRIYAALPFLFAAFEVSFVLSLTGAVFAELLGSGTTVGLGTLVQLYTAKLDMPGLFAVIVVLSIFGVILDYIVKLCARYFLRWNTTAN